MDDMMPMMSKITRMLVLDTTRTADRLDLKKIRNKMEEFVDDIAKASAECNKY
jgi:hypothetical protein